MTLPEQAPTSISLRALRGEPLRAMVVRDMVVASAKALAERHGVDLIDVQTKPDRVICLLAADRVVAIGFAAELRRLTEAWHVHKFDGAALWSAQP